jgi:hypothetical protein
MIAPLPRTCGAICMAISGNTLPEGGPAMRPSGPIPRVARPGLIMIVTRRIARAAVASGKPVATGVCRGHSGTRVFPGSSPRNYQGCDLLVTSASLPRCPTVWPRHRARRPRRAPVIPLIQALTAAAAPVTTLAAPVATAAARRVMTRPATARPAQSGRPRPSWPRPGRPGPHPPEPGRPRPRRPGPHPPEPGRPRPGWPGPGPSVHRTAPSSRSCCQADTHIGGRCIPRVLLQARRF